MINRLFLFCMVVFSAPVVADNAKRAETVDLKALIGLSDQIYSPEYLYNDNLMIIPDGELLSYEYFHKKNNEDIINQLKDEVFRLEVVIKSNNKSNSDSVDVLSDKINDAVESIVNIEETIYSNQVEAKNKVKKLTEAQTIIQNETSSQISIVESKFKALESSLNDLRFKVNVVEGGLADSIGDVKDELALKSKSLSESIFLYLIIFLVFLFIVVFVLIFLTIFFKRKLSLQRSELASNLGDLRDYFYENYAGLDDRLLEIIRDKVESVNSSPGFTGQDKDHSLVIKVSDEIVRIEHNISRMDKTAKGLKQLSASVTRIKDNLQSNGYEIVEMLGEKYDDGYRASVEFVDDESLEPGKQIISRVIKPQINYQGIMIQSAQIEVSQGG